MFTKTFVFLTAIIIYLSCNKNFDYSNPDPGKKKVWNMNINENDSKLFAYTTTGQLHKDISTGYGGGNLTSTYYFLYNASNRITEISSGAGKHKFIYKNNTLRLTENYQGANKVSDNIFNYPGDEITTNTSFAKLDSADGVNVYRQHLKLLTVIILQ